MSSQRHPAMLSDAPNWAMTPIRLFWKNYGNCLDPLAFTNANSSDPLVCTVSALPFL